VFWGILAKIKGLIYLAVSEPFLNYGITFVRVLLTKPLFYDRNIADWRLTWRFCEEEAFLMWLGFVVPVKFGDAIWGGKMGLFWLGIGNMLFTLLASGAIIGVWH
jgi:hypothetical protein